NDDFILHIVGDVSVEDELLAKKDSRVILHGPLTNIEISQLMSKMWIGLASFGLFRKRMKEACTLKVREYLNYGLPIYSGHKDIFPEEFE
ncbi:glycosyltransferase family 1 protein, partial [Acinetobacter baumannii]